MRHPPHLNNNTCLMWVHSHLPSQPYLLSNLFPPLISFLYFATAWASVLFYKPQMLFASAGGVLGPTIGHDNGGELRAWSIEAGSGTTTSITSTTGEAPETRATAIRRQLPPRPWPGMATTNSSSSCHLPPSPSCHGHCLQKKFCNMTVVAKNSGT